MIKVYNLLARLRDLSAEVKITAVALFLFLSTLTALLSQCREADKLRKELEQRQNIKEIEQGVADIKDLVGKVKPPNRDQIEKDNKDANNSSRDSSSTTF